MSAPMLTKSHVVLGGTARRRRREKRTLHPLVDEMSGYKYDEEGGQFFTFALTAVLALLVPYTYRALFPHRERT